MNDPDWARVLVSAGPTRPVGDPTRWGTSTLTVLTAPPALGDLVSVSSQVIQAATRDGYSRCWALNGTLSLPQITWDLVATTKLAYQITLEVQMGVGQAQVRHDICLFQNGTATGSGLCWTQEISQGGPYLRYETPSLSLVPVAGEPDQTYAFAAIGALVGSTINIRANYFLGNADVLPVPGVFPTQSRLNLVLTPFAAGEGL
jgi:hypothetical protein